MCLSFTLKQMRRLPNDYEGVKLVNKGLREVFKQQNVIPIPLAEITVTAQHYAEIGLLTLSSLSLQLSASPLVNRSFVFIIA